jgi:hypothetical protein
VTEAPATPEQTAIKVIQQQRNTAQAKADDLTAQLAIIQGMMQADQKYWAAYVKGLSPAPEKPADK